MGTLTVRIPEALRRELQELCQQQQRCVSEVVRESLRRYVGVQSFQAVRGKTLPFAAAQGFLADEDIFDAIS